MGVDTGIMFLSRRISELLGGVTLQPLNPSAFHGILIPVRSRRVNLRLVQLDMIDLHISNVLANCDIG